MKIILTIPTVVLAAFVLIGPALADDQIIEMKHCNTFCSIWRTVSGNAQHSFADPIPNDVRNEGPAPRPEVGAYAPRVKELVTVHGEVVHKTAAERAADKRQLAAMRKGLEGSEKEQGARPGQ